METLVTDTGFNWRGRKVFITGHTGFKGSWLTLWLRHLGADVYGYALDPPTQPNLFEVVQANRLIARDHRANLSNLEQLKSCLAHSEAEIVFHLAAQSLVRSSYVDPVGTLNTNVLGTAHLLEAVRFASGVRAVIVVTTDKVYENQLRATAHSEEDALGGSDPYSASKAAAEIVTASYRASFFSNAPDHAARIATARAGNVIGGGDWATDRLIPDCLRAFANNQPVHLRYPNAIRPWQHVLEPLAGYVLLAERLLSDGGAKFARAWNFGPRADCAANVAEVAALLAKLWGDSAEVAFATSSANFHEAASLQLNSSRAHAALGWEPRWSLKESLQRSVDWHRAWLQGHDMAAFSTAQIHAYRAG